MIGLVSTGATAPVPCRRLRGLRWVLRLSLHVSLQQTSARHYPLLGSQWVVVLPVPSGWDGITVGRAVVTLRALCLMVSMLRWAVRRPEGTMAVTLLPGIIRRLRIMLI